MQETPLDKATYLSLSTIVAGLIAIEIAGVLFAFPHMEWGILATLVLSVITGIIGYVMNWRRQFSKRDAS